MRWLAIKLLSAMNDEFDPELLDPELELWEGIDTLKRQHREIVTSKCTEEEYMMEGLKEYMENEDAIIAEAEKLAEDIAEYETWAKEQNSAAEICQNHEPDLDVSPTPM